MNSNLRRPLRQVMEKHAGGEVLHIELAEQVSFLNRPVIEQALRSAAPGTQILLDASLSDDIDPDILAMIRDFVKKSSIHNVKSASAASARSTPLTTSFNLSTTRLRNSREDDAARCSKSCRTVTNGFANRRLSRDLGRQVQVTSAGQHPFAVILSCIDWCGSGVETILDLGVGDVFTARVAGNVVSPKVLGSLSTPRP